MKSISVLLLVATLCYFVNCQEERLPEFAAYNYWWPMRPRNGETKRKISYTYDKSIGRAKAELHDVSFIKVPRLQYAARLSGDKQWIHVSTGRVRDCLAFQFYSCGEESITVQLWIRMHGGKRILATASYTNATHGPGILMEYDEKGQMLNVEFANEKKVWKVQELLVKHRWYLVMAQWNKAEGLRLVLDGQLKSQKNDKEGSPVPKATKSSYNKMITVGRPLKIMNEKEFGNFDIAHLLFYFRDLSKLEIEEMPKISLQRQPDDLEGCCEEKEHDGCYQNNPCSSLKCVDFERNYTDCICPQLQHKICKDVLITKDVLTTKDLLTTKELFTTKKLFTTKYLPKLSSEFPTTPLPTQRQDCAKSPDKVSFKWPGCKNKFYSGKPVCGKDVCYYGKCGFGMNDEEKCECTKYKGQCDRVPKRAVCGSDDVTYESLCVLAMYSCLMKKEVKKMYDGPCNTMSDDNATNYWSMSDIKTRVKNGETTATSTDEYASGEAKLLLKNDVKTYKDQQLGQVLKFDGVRSHIEIFDVSKRITTLTSRDGITFSFWMKFYNGDYIMSAGGYHTKMIDAPGFRLQRDPVTNFFKLEVSSEESSAVLYIESFPKRWFHLLFTWHPIGGLKLYINGMEKLYMSGERKQQKHFKKSVHIDELGTSYTQKIVFANEDSRNEMTAKGKFDLAHISIWEKVLSANEVKRAYKAHVKVVGMKYCCYMKENSCHKITECICTNHDKDLEVQMEKCQNRFIPPTVCGDRSEHCGKLINNQGGYCRNFEYYAEQSCGRSCQLCNANTSAFTGPKKHFKKQTFIFAILGCVGGLILLFGVTFYFWKVYRTRCHGTFVPPSKSASLLEVSEYEDEKWPHKFVDSNAFYIKDVPPKKRALPLIPAKNSQTNYRYQPPEFD